MKKVAHFGNSIATFLSPRNLHGGLGAYLSLLLIPVLVFGPLPMRAFAQAAVEQPSSAAPATSAEPAASERSSAALAAATGEPPEHSNTLPTFGPSTAGSPEGSAIGPGGMANVDPSTGAAQASISFQLPRARGQAQPSLGISYSSSAGTNTEVGYAWSLNIPKIERENRGGGPLYTDQDRFRINGVELVKICVVSGGQCSGGTLLTGEQLPNDVGEGTSYFRTRVDDGARYFLSADGKNWRAQYKSGVEAEFGVPKDAADDKSGIDVDTDFKLAIEPIFRWNLVRLWSEAHANVVVYRWVRLFNESSRGYLQDILDTPKVDVDVSRPAAVDLGQFAHHTRITYEDDYVRGFRLAAIWRARPAHHISRVDVSSADFDNPGNERRSLVRRYTLDYTAPFTHAQQVRHFLQGVHLRGACPNLREDADFSFPNTTCSTPERDIAQMTYTGEGDVNRSPGAGGLVSEFQQTFYGEQTHVSFVDLDSNDEADVMTWPPSDKPVQVGIRQRPYDYVEGTLGVENANWGATANKLVFSNVGSWNTDGKVNFLWWEITSDRKNTGRYQTYSPKRSGSNNWLLSGSDVRSLPPESIWLKMANASESFNSAGMVQDFDGDGYPDVRSELIRAASEGELARSVTCYFFTTRDAAGNIVPNSRTPTTEEGTPPKEPDCIPTDKSSRYYAPLGKQFYADFSGDGIPDRLMMRWVDRNFPDQTRPPIWDQKWTVEFGVGNGTFRESKAVEGGLLDSHNWLIADTYIHDLNADGIADRIDVRNTAYESEWGEGMKDPSPGIDIYLGDGKQWGHPPIHLAPGGPDIPNWANMEHKPPISGGGIGRYYQPMQLQFADQFGNGMESILVTSQTEALYKKVARIDLINTNGRRPGLLATISNGRGATTTLEYARVGGVPGAIRRVSKVTVSSNADPKESGGPYVTTYDHSEPVYDYVERQLLGFRKVRTTVGDANDPKRVITDTRYLIGSCANDAPCAPTVDDPRMAVRGLPVTVDSFDASNVHLSTVHRQYKMDKLYDGVDGRKVRRVYPQQTDTWTFNTANFVADGSLIDVVDLASDELTLNGKDTIASRSNSVHTRVTQDLNLFGNVNYQADYGVVESFDPAIPKDSSVVTFNLWTLPADSTHWLWRPRETFVRVSQGTPDLRHSYFEYNQRGQVVKTFSDLTGTVPLQRFHEESAAVAPPPGDASQDGTRRLVSETVFDNFGNPKRVKNATGIRCADTAYDKDYGELPIAKTVYTGGCGVGALTTTTGYDRGLEVVTAITEPTGAVSTTTYDGWGRPTATYAPDPEIGVLPSTAAPSVKMTYFDVQGGPYQRVQLERRVDDGLVSSQEPETPRYVSAWSYVDPYGRNVGAWKQADPANGDQAAYIASGRVERDSRGFVVRAFEPYFTNEAPQSPNPPAVPAGSVQFSVAFHDAFGRTTDTFGLEGEPTGKVQYFALSENTFDAADLVQGASPRPVWTSRDGHGRVTVTAKSTSQNGTADSISTRLIYTPTGEVSKVVRTHTAGTDTYTREMTYDSWGRLVQTAEPNTSINFGATNLRTWHYAYNDSGDLVGTSDARGCGKNIERDGLGRPTSETYSPCLKTHRAYDERHVTKLFIYDAPEQGQAGVTPGLFAGKLSASYDRAQHTRYNYDGRGRMTEVWRQLAVPDLDDLALGGGGGFPLESSSAAADGGAAPTPGGEYAPHWYRTAFSYDEANRERGRSIGTRSAGVPELYGDPVSQGWLVSNDVVVTTYTARGVTKTIGTSYGDLILGKRVDADGFVGEVLYGNAPQRFATEFEPNPRRGLAHTWVTGPSTGPAVLQDWTFKYDAMDNPLLVKDGRNPNEWLDGAKPVDRQLSYDDLNQLRRVDYTYNTPSKDDKQVSVFDAETKSGDTRPIPDGNQANRVRWQSYDFDWQGNLIKSDDDAHAFHDRSLGTMTYGPATNGPNRVASAEGIRGRAQATYDRTGNLTKLTVIKPGPTGTALNIAFSYEWDEVGQMVRAKREPIPGVANDRGADFHYTYDSGGTRITKSVEDPDTHQRTYTSEIFSTLRLEHARFQDGDYERTKDTVSAYLVANGTSFARLIYDETLPQGRIGGAKHVFFTLTDPLGSTSTVVDKNTGELVERTTYLAYGQSESDYRPERWKGYREHFRFTGKEDDVGVGLTYFGARYYVAALGQWASADPLTIHVARSDLNPYAYVFGSPQKLVDPMGLQTCQGSCEPQNAETGSADLGWNAFMNRMEDWFTGRDRQRFIWSNTTPRPQLPGAPGTQEDTGYYEQWGKTWDCPNGSCSLIITVYVPPRGQGGLFSFLPRDRTPNDPFFRWRDPLKDAIDAIEENYYQGIAQGKSPFHAAITNSGCPLGSVGTCQLEGSVATPGGAALEAASAENAALLRNSLMAEEIAGGHAYGKHVIKQGEFPRVLSPQGFASEIESFLNHPETVMRNLSGGRSAYWNDSLGSVLIRNPTAADGGTFFKPTAGRAYFEGLQ
ncbi:hypothetical protein LZC95_06400 [Pendulispora brunnea]|uniref:Uncharacterized protein n=1 Tax=Pendulispora brunnea TaxID=2905690 RepID=A0ABZ2KEI4_9BACT